MAEIAIPPGHILRLRDSQFRDIYANSTQTHLGPFDITIVFQKIGEISPDQPGSTDLISVAMSPQHFKAFVRSANETLEAYEATFGKLEIPEADIAAKRNAKEIQTLLETARQQARAVTEAIINPSSTEPPPPSKRSRGAARKKET